MNTTAEQLAHEPIEDEVDVEELDTEDTTETATSADPRETQTFSPAIIPTKDELKEICANIKDSFNFSVDVKPTLFRFKTSKDANGVEIKRDALELPIPYPTVQGVVAILEEGGKELELLMDAIETVITTQARSIISDDWEINATNLPVDKLSWKHIANMPKPERMGGGIAKEVWDDFAKDYIKVMPEITGKTVDQVTQAAKLLVNKLSAVKTNVPVLELLVNQLTVYVGNTARADEFASCVEFLVDKADKLLHTTPEELLANL